MEQSVINPDLKSFPPNLAAKTVTFPYPVTDFQVIHTHISLVLLAGDFAYKIKKPVRYPFVDYSTLEKRRGFCRREVELNRRLAPDVYLGVVPVTRSGDGLSLEGAGEPLEYAVKMRRLPDAQRLNRLLEEGKIPDSFWPHFVERLVSFYDNAPRGPEVSVWAEPGAVEQDWDQILFQLGGLLPTLLAPGLRNKLREAFHQAWDWQRPWIESRVDKAREGHGDLRLEHIYYFPNETPPRDLQIIDCVEFDPRYRCGDPLLDIAFLAADLETQGHNREIRLLSRAWMDLFRDEDGALLSFYTAYRHLVRGLVRGLQADESDSAPSDREKAAGKSRRHFFMALQRLAQPEARSCLVLLSGLPAAGKSSLAWELERQEGFKVLSSDLVRKELAGFPSHSRPTPGWNQDIYTPSWTDHTYSALLERARAGLLNGERVLVDASFWEQSRREPFRRLAQELGLPFLFFTCRTDAETARERLKKNERFGSDADWEIYQHMAGLWQDPPSDWEAVGVVTEGSPQESLREIRRILGKHNLSRLEGPEGE